MSVFLINYNDEEDLWEISDPDGDVFADFYDEDAAIEYVAWMNGEYDDD